MQITAQLDEERAEKLQRLQSLTQLSAEEILSRGIDLVEQQEMDRQQVERCRERLESILDSGFVGCLKDAPEDLSANYRRYFAEAMQEKYDAMQQQYHAG